MRRSYESSCAIIHINMRMRVVCSYVTIHLTASERSSLNHDTVLIFSKYLFLNLRVQVSVVCAPRPRTRKTLSQESVEDGGVVTRWPPGPGQQRPGRQQQLVTASLSPSSPPLHSRFLLGFTHTPASYTSMASNIRNRPITPGLLYVLPIGVA